MSLRDRIEKAAKDFEYAVSGYCFDEVRRDGTHSNPNAERARLSALLLREVLEHLPKENGMNISFENGATVNRVWPDGSGEVIAAFQYVGHAGSFANTMAKDETQPRDVDFIVADHRDGKVTVHKQPVAGAEEPPSAIPPPAPEPYRKVDESPT